MAVREVTVAVVALVAKVLVQRQNDRAMVVLVELMAEAVALVEHIPAAVRSRQGEQVESTEEMVEILESREPPEQILQT